MLLTTLAILIFVFVLIVDIAHYVTMFGFLRKMRIKEWQSPATPYEPKAAVLLTLRGADPFLARCVEGLMRQKYKDYTIFFIVDHESDPALPVVNALLEQYPEQNHCVVVVQNHFDTCSLKCNSLYHLLDSLDESFEVVATIDADAIPKENWLRELVEPLSDPRFGVASGIRWYLPEKNTMGALVRRLWNIAAVNQMVFCRIPWGGSLVLRKDVFRQPEMKDMLCRSFSDDVPLYALARSLGKQVVVTPSLLMVNREQISLCSFYEWVKRQVMCARFYHPRWTLLVAQAFFLTVPLLVAFVLGLVGLWRQEMSLASWSFGAIALYILGVLGALLIMDGDVRKYLRSRGETLPPQSCGVILKTTLAVALTQLVYSCAIVGVFRMSQVWWRGVCYVLEGKGKVRLVEYIPYADVAQSQNPSTDETVSL
ncbi:MAG: glycosyltransferase family 2 protein [Planctomycetia bacterium]|nr:glycosyltransferase family 2 protein [Planctomycetia bacterium]